MIPTESCEKCAAHYQKYKDGIDFAVNSINQARPHLSKEEIFQNYIDRYHGRGHRKALRND